MIAAAAPYAFTLAGCAAIACLAGNARRLPAIYRDLRTAVRLFSKD